MKKIVFVLIFSISNILLAQSKKIFGSVSDNIDVMGNVNIYNINSKRASITNDSGEFEMFVKLKDTLEFSFMGYKTAKITINNSHFGMVGLRVKLKKEAIALDVVYVKRHNLIGQLASDIDRVKDKKGGDFSAQLRLPFPNAKVLTYEERKMNMIGGGGLIGQLIGLLNGESRKVKKMIKTMKEEKELIKLEKEYSYFTQNDLKIRKENVSIILSKITIFFFKFN